MVPVRNVRRLASSLLLVGVAAVGLAGCVLVPAPVPVAAPVIVAPRPVYGYSPVRLLASLIHEPRRGARRGGSVEEERPGFAGAFRTFGGPWGALRGPPCLRSTL